MRIGINARFLTAPYTGIGQYTYHLLGGLSEIDQENEYFLFTPELVSLDLPNRFHQVRVPEGKSRSASIRKADWEHNLVPQEMEKAGVDLAHFLYPANPRRRLPFPTLVTIHDAIPWVLSSYNRRLRSKLYHFYVKLALKKVDHFLTVSEFF